MEKQTFFILQEIAYDRFLLELASGEEIITIIEQCIQQARPLHSLWLVTPDAMPVIDPETIWLRLESFLPDSEVQRFDEFAGITRPERLILDHNNGSLDDIPVTFFPDDYVGKRPSSSPPDLNRPNALHHKVLMNQMNTANKNTTTTTTTSALAHPMSYDSYEAREGKLSEKSLEKTGVGGGRDMDGQHKQGVGKDNAAHHNPDISPGRKAESVDKKLDRIPSYNYLKTLMPPHGYHRIQKENYLANQGRLSTSNNSSTKTGPPQRSGSVSGPATGNNATNAVPAKAAPSILESQNPGSDENSVSSRSIASAPPSRRHDKEHSKAAHSHSKHNEHRPRDSPKNGNHQHSSSRTGSGNKNKAHHASHASHHNDRPRSGQVDPKEYEKYEAERRALEEKLMVRRELREKEFLALGMSLPNAKLAAYNELLLEEQHAWSDFDNHHKRMIHSASEAHHSSTASLGTPHHSSK